MKWNCRLRCALVCAGFATLFTAFSYRLIDLQLCQHQTYLDKAAGQDERKKIIPAERGAIYDAHGAALALDDPVETVVADPRLINDRAKTAEALSEALKISPNELAKKLALNKRYVILQRQMPEAQAVSLGQKLDAAKLRGVRFERDFVRRYPNGAMLCHVVGFTDFDHHGIQGVEMSMEQYLRGQDGFRCIEQDPKGREIVLYRGAERAPRNGYDIRLTIDLNLQNIVENELDAAMRQYTPEKATIILMRPKTGEILAMANRPNFDLNQRATAAPEQMINRAILDMMEPGSTFKIVTVGAALNEHKVQLNTPIFCENGPWLYGGYYLHDHKYYGEIPVQDVLVKSSNIGAAKLALMLGQQKFYEYICRFGFGDRTGIELPGEIPGRIYPPSRWSKISITRMPMGHEVGVTPLQMIMAMTTIANGGKLVAPRIVKSITDEKGQTISEAKPLFVRQVISEETAAKVNLALRGVVSARGTAEGAAVPGFNVSGKTGTAQKTKPNGGYEKGKEVVSFSGFLPSEDPAFVALVVLDNAHTKTAEENYGGKIAGPIFARVAEKAARYLELEPHEEMGAPVVVGRVALTNASR